MVQFSGSMFYHIEAHFCIYFISNDQGPCTVLVMSNFYSSRLQCPMLTTIARFISLKRAHKLYQNNASQPDEYVHWYKQ